MSLEDCARLVEKADPVRFRAAMSAEPSARADLFVLYAFNVEVFHAVWSSYEPMIGEIRLQYWSDQIAAAYQGKATDPHPVMTPLLDIINKGWLPEADFQAMITARLWEVHSEPFEDQAALNTYLMDTGGRLMAMASRLLQMNDHYDNAIRNYGAAAALAAFLVAVPKLKSRNRHPLPDERPETLRALAKDALTIMDATRTKRHRSMAVALPALLTVTEARPVLKRIIKTPSCVLNAGLERSGFNQRLRAVTCDVLKRW